MTYRYRFTQQFAQEFANYPLDQQEAILDFLEVFEQYGLADFSHYQGKISPSWKNSADNFARDNHLWHYHIGLPHYRKAHNKYQTSDMILHFQWRYGDMHILVVDITWHYKANGSFWLPSADRLLD